MEKAELLNAFEAQLDQFEKYQTYIKKAQQHAERFNPLVVEKVIRDHTERSTQVADAIAPMVEEMSEVIGGIEAELASIAQGIKDSKVQLETYELRLMIEEISQEDFDEGTSELQGSIKEADEKTEGLNGELASFQGALERWAELRPVSDEDLLDDDELEDDLDIAENTADEADEEVLDIGEDFNGDSDAGVRVQELNASDDVSMVLEEEDEGESLFSSEDLEDLGDAESESASVSKGNKSAANPFLVRDEGVDSERIYDFGDGVEVMSIGRGRENVVQVTGDSKVSRSHCKLYKRNGNYFIEDNQSANGTLVDGEMIKERRLFGGEEIIIGETAFRFRISA